MDTIQSVSDADFDSFWEDESKNKNRNRIRVGRQYQAKVPSLLKPGQSDGRNLSELETLHWRPGAITEDQLEHYLSVARAVGQFSKAIYHSENQSETCLQSALRGLSEFVNSHHPGHRDAGCRASRPAEWSPAETQLFAQALGACRKNFPVIKKDFLPWKSSHHGELLDHLYYPSKEDEASTSAKEEDESKPACTEGVVIQPKKEEPDEEEEQPIKKEAKEEIKVEVKEEEEENGAEQESGTSQDSNAAGTLGTLQFYFDGQVVLELSAQEKGQTTRWVQTSRSLPGRCKKLSQEHASVFPPVEEPEEPLEQPVSDEDGGGQPASKRPRLVQQPTVARKTPTTWWGSREDSPSEEASPSKRTATPSRPPKLPAILSQMLSSPVPAHYLNPGASTQAEDCCPLDLSSSRDEVASSELGAEGQDLRGSQDSDWLPSTTTTTTPWMPYLPSTTSYSPSTTADLPLDLSAAMDDHSNGSNKMAAAE